MFTSGTSFLHKPLKSVDKALLPTLVMSERKETFCKNMFCNNIIWMTGVSTIWTLGRGPKMKNGPINKILRIQLGLYIRKPGKFNLAHENLILMRGIAVENLKTPIMGSKIKVVVNFIYGYQNPIRRKIQNQ